MAYQDNNNRVVPNKAENTALQPQATPVDKTIKYQADVSGVGSTKATADALAKLGQGIMDYDFILRRQAQEAAINAFESTEIDKNKREWADVSRRVDGMAKFNPYVKDEYLSLTAQDIYRSSMLKINSNPNLYKMNEQEFNTFITGTKSEMMTAFKESQIDPRFYGAFVQKFSQDSYNVAQVYTVKNSEYTYNNSLTKHGSDLAFNLGANTYQISNEAGKAAAISQTLNAKIAECLENGIPKDDIAQKILGIGLQSYIVENADTLNSASLIAAVKDIKIGETPLNEIIPNYGYELHKLVRTAKRANYEDRKADFDDEQLTLKINTNAATKDFFSWFKNNQNASPAEVQQQALGFINKYGIDENGVTFLHTVASTKSLITDLKEVNSDPSVLQELGRKAAIGTLTGAEVSEALANKQIGWKEGLQFIDRLDRQAKTEVKEFDNSAKDFDAKMKKEGIYGKTLKNTKEYTKLINQRNQITMDLDSGKITADQARSKMAELDRIANSIRIMKSTKDKNVSLLTNANYVKAQSYPTYSFGTASNAFKNLGLIRGGIGQRIDGNITSGINPNRTINGKNKPHKGYDLGALEGTTIRNCNTTGKVVAAGYEDSMGNYAIVQYPNGYARYMHLQNNVGNLNGTQLLPNQSFAKVGKTGKGVTGSHLHVDFWNKNMELVNVETFAKGIK